MEQDRPKVKIIRVVSRMNVGGPAWQISVLQRRLAAHEFESLLVCGHVVAPEADFIALRDPTLPHRSIEGLGRSVTIVNNLRALIALIKLIRTERPDIVHTHTAKAGVLGRIAAIISRVSIRVHTFHGHVLHGYFSPRKTRMIVFVEKVLASRTSALVAVGERVRDELVHEGIGRPDQYTVVSPGVSVAPLIDRPAARQKLGIDERAPVVLFVGRLTPIKRPDRLVDTFRLIQRLLPSALLVVVGEGELLDDTRLRASDLGTNVIFTGWRADLDAIYPAADVVLLTSDNEGMPVTLLEASSCGLPCVSTDVGSVREVVINDSTGFVVGKSPEVLAAATARLLMDQPMARRLGQEARRHVETNFGLIRLVENYSELYRSLLICNR